MLEHKLGWEVSERKPARGKITSVSQGSEAENLKTLGAPEGGEGASVSEMFVTGVDNTVHSLAPPLSYRGEQVLSFTPSRRRRRWLSIEVGTADCGDKVLYWKEGDWFWFGELLISGLLPLLDSADSDLEIYTLLGRKSEDSFLGNWPTQETRPTDADIWGSLGEKLSSLSFDPIWSSPVNNHPHPYTAHKHEFR